MKKEFVWQFIRPIIIFIVLYIVNYFGGFLAGYAANNSTLNKEIRLFIYFVIAHLVINFLYFLKDRKMGIKLLIFTSIEVLILWTLDAWNSGYFNL